MRIASIFILSILSICACGPVQEVVPEAEPIPAADLSFWADLDVFVSMPTLWEQAYDITQNQIVAKSPDDAIYIDIKDSRVYGIEAFRAGYLQFLNANFIVIIQDELATHETDYYSVSWIKSELYARIDCLPDCRHNKYTHYYFEIVSGENPPVIMLFSAVNDGFESNWGEILIILNSLGLSGWPHD